MNNLKVSRFSNYKSNKSDGEIDLWSWLMVENHKYTPIVDKIRSTNDPEIRKNLKSQLPAITPSGIFNKRCAEGILKYTGIICIDIDAKENPSITDFEAIKIVLSNNPYILYCGLSVSGCGLFCLIKIAQPQNHKHHFYALENDFSEIGITIDKSCSDICRLRGYSYDKNAYVNPNASIYENFIEISNVRSKINKVKTQSNYQANDKSSNNQNLDISNSEVQSTKADIRSDILNYSLDNIKVLVTSHSKDICNLIERVVERKIDITSNYNDWFIIGCFLANTFKENGRELFHNVSQFYPQYTIEETDSLYSNCLNKQYCYNSRQVFDIARKYGLE